MLILGSKRLSLSLCGGVGGGGGSGGGVCAVIFVSNPTTVLRLCCVVVGVVTIFPAISNLVLMLNIIWNF